MRNDGRGGRFSSAVTSFTEACPHACVQAFRGGRQHPRRPPRPPPRIPDPFRRVLQRFPRQHPLYLKARAIARLPGAVRTRFLSAACKFLRRSLVIIPQFAFRHAHLPQHYPQVPNGSCLLDEFCQHLDVGILVAMVVSVARSTLSSLSKRRLLRCGVPRP